MRLSSIIARVALGFALALLLCGCSTGSSARQASIGDDPLGYYEVRHDQGIIVLGSMASAEKAKAGKLPAKTVRRLGSGGVAVFFEADNVTHIEIRLIGEYSRRHGLAD